MSPDQLMFLRQYFSLCVRDERNACRQGVLGNLLRGLVVSIGVFHCVELHKGGRHDAVGDETSSLPVHVGTGLLLGGCRVGSDL